MRPPLKPPMKVMFRYDESGVYMCIGPATGQGVFLNSKLSNEQPSVEYKESLLDFSHVCDMPTDENFEIVFPSNTPGLIYLQGSDSWSFSFVFDTVIKSKHSRSGKFGGAVYEEQLTIHHPIPILQLAINMLDWDKAHLIYVIQRSEANQLFKKWVTC